MLYRKLGSEKVGGRANKNRSFLFPFPLMIMSLILFFYFRIRAVFAFLLNKFVGFFVLTLREGQWRWVARNLLLDFEKSSKFLKRSGAMPSSYHILQLNPFNQVTYNSWNFSSDTSLYACCYWPTQVFTENCCLFGSSFYLFVSLCLFPSILLKFWGLKSA